MRKSGDMIRDQARILYHSIISMTGPYEIMQFILPPAFDAGTNHVNPRDVLGFFYLNIFRIIFSKS
jgi:hypothetical protein